MYAIVTYLLSVFIASRLLAGGGGGLVGLSAQGTKGQGQ